MKVSHGERHGDAHGLFVPVSKKATDAGTTSHHMLSFRFVPDLLYYSFHICFYSLDRPVFKLFKDCSL